MEDNSIKHKIKSFYARTKNAKYITFVIVFFLVNMVFLTSKAWYTYSTSQYFMSKPGSKIEAPFGRHFNVISWVYSKSQKMIELQLEVDLDVVNGKNTYNYVCIDRKLKSYSVKKIIETDTYIVLHIENVPDNWTELSLQIYQDNKDKAAKIYANSRDIATTDKIVVKTLEEYYIARIDILIANYNNDIENYNRKIEAEYDNIKNYTTLIKDYELQLNYVAANEEQDLLNKIESYKKEIEVCNSKIVELNAQIDGANKAIEDLKETKKQYIK